MGHLKVIQDCLKPQSKLENILNTNYKLLILEWDELSTTLVGVEELCRKLGKVFGTQWNRKHKGPLRT